MVFKTEGEDFAFVSRNGWALEHVPEAAKTEDECIAAATLDCRVLRLLPARFKTPRLCLEAVKADGLNMVFACALCSAKNIDVFGSCKAVRGGCAAAVKRQGENTVGDRLKTHHSLRPSREACPRL